MLVLNRRNGERVLIGEDIVITVLSLRGGVVRLGITAPKEIAVHREEVARDIEKEGEIRKRN